MRFRAPMFDDATAVLDVLVARDIADLGVPDHTFEDLRDEWRESSFDLATDAFVAETDAGLIVGYAAIIGPGIQALVAPDHEGQGIGMRLLNWAEPRDRERGRERHRQWVAASNQRGRALLLAAGYQPAPRYWRLVRRLDDLANVESPPAGVNLRPLDVEADAATVYALNETSFAANPDYRPQPLITFYEEHLHAHDLDPATSCVAEHANMPIGFLLACQWQEERVGFVDLLGVHPNYRRRGLATATLTASFRAFATAGLREAQLGVASDTRGHCESMSVAE
jgi:mycothiol synthase